MMLVVLLAVVCLASESLSAMSVPFKQGHYVMKSIRQMRFSNSYIDLKSSLESCSFFFLDSQGNQRILNRVIPAKFLAKLEP